MIHQDRDKLWNKPKLIKLPRPASLLELFFDIVVVALIGGIGHKMIYDFQHDQTTWFSIAFIVLQTLSVLIIWRALTMYSIKFEVYDLRHRLVIFSCMLPMVLMAATAYAKDSLSDIYIIYMNLSAYAFLMFAVSWIFISAAFNNGEDKFFFWYLMIKGIARVISLLLVILSILLPIIISGYKSINEHKWSVMITCVWAAEFSIQLLADVFSSRRRYTSHFPNISRHLLKERFSILYIAFLGEMLIQIVSSFAKYHTTESFTYLIAAILQVFLMFWIYFDLLNYNDLKKSYRAIWVYSFIMLLMFFSMLFISCGLSLAIKTDAKDAMILLVIGNLLYIATSKLALFSFSPFNKARRYIESKWFKSILVIIWACGLIISSTLTFVLHEEHVMIWTVIGLEIVTIGLATRAMVKSQRENSDLTDEEFEAKLPPTTKDW